MNNTQTSLVRTIKDNLKNPQLLQGLNLPFVVGREIYYEKQCLEGASHFYYFNTDDGKVSIHLVSAIDGSYCTEKYWFGMFLYIEDIIKLLVEKVTKNDPITFHHHIIGHWEYQASPATTISQLKKGVRVFLKMHNLDVLPDSNKIYFPSTSNFSKSLVCYKKISSTNFYDFNGNGVLIDYGFLSVKNGTKIIVSQKELKYHRSKN